MRVPGDIYSALIESGELPDPYLGENEPDCQWPGREDWRIERTFRVDGPLFESSALRLIAEVIDTVGEVYINGKLAGRSANMFCRFEADLRTLLQRGENSIAVLIRSPERAAAEAAASLPYPIPASVYPISSPHRNLIRKAQCMSGWDWGPCLMTGGIYDGIRIVGTEGPLIRSVRARTAPCGQFGEEDALVASRDAAPEGVRQQARPGGRHVPRGVACGPDFSVDIAAEIEVPCAMDVRFAAWLAGTKIEVRRECAPGIAQIRARLIVNSPKLWWPNGSGEPALYDLHVAAWRAGPADARDHAGFTAGVATSTETAMPCEFSEDKAAIPARATLSPTATASSSAVGRPRTPSPHLIHKRIGFRELSVIAEEDSIGRSFKFRVNGRDIFAKGANWIPADALPSRWTKARVANLLDSAVDAHMNCLRVWGGGRYESDDFYELCDERGIMLWQDCMFSCALYPSDKDFLGNVEREISWQVRRLADHPSLALWCGNNEALGAITWYEESNKNPARYIVDYDRLTEGTLGRMIRELDPGRCFWPSSPSAGPNDFSDNWHSDERGDMHFWSVWHEGKPFTEYQTVAPRFCSEFGFQAFPSMPTIASFAPQSEWNVSSPTMEAHQKHPRGNSLIIETMLRYFRMPKGFAELVYLSQVQQALAIRAAIQYWRSSMPRCMGTLYWQLNDVWPVTSWSSLNYDGSWKLLHYEAARLYAPVMLALFVEGGEIRARLVSETDGGEAGAWEAWAGNASADIALRFVGFDGEDAGMPVVELHVPLQAGTVQEIWDMPLSALPGAPDKVYLEASLSAPGLGIAAVEALFLTEPKRCCLADPGLEAALSVERDGTTLLCLEATRAPAFFVAPELDGVSGRFEDSGFYLPRGKKRTLKFEHGSQNAWDSCTPFGRAAQNRAAHAIAEASKGDNQRANLRIHHLQNSFDS